MSDTDYYMRLQRWSHKRLQAAERGEFSSCYCGSGTYLGDSGRGHSLVCCCRTMQDTENCFSPEHFASLNAERDEYKRQLAIWEANDPCPECGEKHVCGVQAELDRRKGTR